MSDATDDIRQVLGRFIAGLGFAAAAAAAFTGLSYGAGSIYLGSFLARLGAVWALNAVSAPMRVSAGWWVVAGVAAYCVVLLGDAFQNLPLPQVATMIARRAEVFAILAFLATGVVFLVFGDSRSAMLGFFISYIVVASFLMIKVAALIDLLIAGLSKPDPFTVRWLASSVVQFSIFAFILFPWAAGQAWALHHLCLDLRSLPLAEVHDVNSAVPRKCRVILTTEERLLCIDPSSLVSRKPFAPLAVQVIPWANVRTVYDW
jgi:hypothetical protein